MGTLPAKPSLDQLRKRAKDLARAEGVKLSEAQFRIARDHGFPSWPKLQAYVRRVTEHGETLQHPYHQDVEYYASHQGNRFLIWTNDTGRNFRLVEASEDDPSTWSELVAHRDEAWQKMNPPRRPSSVWHSASRRATPPRASSTRSIESGDR